MGSKIDQNTIQEGIEKVMKKKKGTRMDFDVLYGAKLGWEMATLCVPKGLQKTSEK